MTTSALERRSTSISRSSWMPSSRRPSACSGCGRRTLSKRRTSASSVASRKTRLGCSPRSRAAAMASESMPNHPRERTSTTTATCCIAASGLRSRAWSRRSASAESSCGGRLSTTSQPRSSSTLAAVERPAPLMPVTMTMGASASDRRGVGRGRRSFENFSRREVHGWLRRCTLSQVGRDGRGKRGSDAGHRHDVGGLRLTQAFDRPEVPQERLLPARPQTGYAVELARRHRLGPALAVEGDGEAVGLVPQALEQVEALARARQDHRVVEARAATPPRGAWRARRGRPPRCRARRAPPARR